MSNRNTKALFFSQTSTSTSAAAKKKKEPLDHGKYLTRRPRNRNTKTPVSTSAAAAKKAKSKKPLVVKQDDEDNRWSLQEEIDKILKQCLKYGLCYFDKGPPCSISRCSKQAGDDGDYICTSVIDMWPDIKKTSQFTGPSHAALEVVHQLHYIHDFIESSFVYGPGLLQFKLSSKWISKGIYKMLKDGICTWAPKLSVKKTIIYFLSRNITKEMHTGHLRSTVIGETLARILEYSRVEVIRRFHRGDDPDIELKMMMAEFLIERFPNGEVNDQAIGDLEVLYKDSKKRFAEDAKFRERSMQGWDERHQIAWVRICKISQERYQKLYKRLGVHMKEEGKSLYDSYISKTRNLLREKGLNIDCGGQELPLVDLAALWHSVDMVKADWVVHVTDVEQQDYIEMCIAAAKHAVNDLCHHSFSHVGFGVKGDDFQRFVNLVYLLDEVKSRCKTILLGQGKAGKWTTEKLEHTAEALGYGAVKYAYLKNHRFTNCTLSVEEMLNEKGNTVVYLQYTLARVWSITRKSRNKIKKLKVKEVEELILKNNTERDLGIHLLRFTEILEEVCKVVMPHILCDYLFDLSKKFDRLYYSVCEKDKSDGSGEKTDEETSTLLLYEATAVVMKKCFHLLGITPISTKSDF